MPARDSVHTKETAPGSSGPGEDFEHHFSTISRLMHRIAGVHLTEKKRQLVRSRLRRRIRALGFEGFGEYVEHVRSESGRDELATMVDVLTTNKTSFFRESVHFEFLEQAITTGSLADRPRLRFWSAGCSSGEEPYSLALLLENALSRTRFGRARILATDINSQALRKARSGRYEENKVRQVPHELRRAGFERRREEPGVYTVTPTLRSRVRFARLNLLEEWPMSGPFHVILCRNVMIYFDRSTCDELVRRFTDLLAPGGYFLCGHSESLNSYDHELEYVQPAVYRK